ncbi:alpha-amylase [Legionella lansingensis]|nr:alpha-amylase family protein [Legionella lansingensis]SNV51631.1 alpha-amylase [Legionella lansingensis]
MATNLGHLSYPANGNLRMYNMHPYRSYVPHKRGIDGMIDYVPEIGIDGMKYNAAWINPVQLTGTLLHPHPDGLSQVSGSFYAMTDDEAFNPLIFPNCNTEECQAKLKKWTASVRLNGMFPIFDLVLNHIGINQGEPSPLQKKLGEAGLLLAEVNERWPDIQGIDYYRAGSTNRGLTTPMSDLDPVKIDKVFEILWEPFIRRYILDYGFMGVRVDALTHVPVPVQQRAYALVQKLVNVEYGTDAIVVGELMVAVSPNQLSALSACGLTHCLNPYSFFWGHCMEGGYEKTAERSPFIKQNQRLAEIVLSPEAKKISAYKIQIIAEYNKEKHKQPNTIYIVNQSGKYRLVINGESSYVALGITHVFPLSVLEEYSEIEQLIDSYRNVGTGKQKGEAQLAVRAWLEECPALQRVLGQMHFQSNKGSLIAVSGNHDVGTLKAKVMLDIAYGRAMTNVGADERKIEDIQNTYKEFKNIIKGIVNTNDLMRRLQAAFGLTEKEKQHLFLEVNMRMREKLFIQAMMCRGWYSLGGDEVGVCHKPEVFAQFGENPGRIGSSLLERAHSKCSQHDLRGFIRGVNEIMDVLPKPAYNDRATMHYLVLENEEFGVKAAEFLFVVVRYSAKENKYCLLGHTAEHLGDALLADKLRAMLASEPCLNEASCDVLMLDQHGEVIRTVLALAKEEKKNNQGIMRRTGASASEAEYIPALSFNFRDSFFSDPTRIKRDDRSEQLLTNTLK